MIQARIGSSRLPGKVLYTLAGKPVLERVVTRVANASLVDEAVVITSHEKKDDVICHLCESLGISYYRGSEEDVLDRYYQAAIAYNVEHVVRMTADCPLASASVIDDTIRHYLETEADYTNNLKDHTYPDGLDVEVFSFKALHKAWKKASLPSEREHVTQYIVKHPEMFKLEGISTDLPIGHLRLTLDNPEDFKLISLIYDNLAPKNEFFGLQEIIFFLNENPEHALINQTYNRNEGLEKSLQGDAEKMEGKAMG